MRTLMRVLSVVFAVFAAMLFAVPAFAQGGTAANGSNWVAVAAGLAMAIASAECGLGQGPAAASATDGIARNPSARAMLQPEMIIGLAFIDALALYTLLI